MLRGMLLRECGTQTDWIIGYRHLRLDDRVAIHEQLTSPLLLAGTQFSVDDQFATRNSFHGLELGLIRTERQRCWNLDYFAKVALGWNDASVRIRGETVVASPGFPPRNISRRSAGAKQQFRTIRRLGFRNDLSSRHESGVSRHGPMSDSHWLHLLILARRFLCRRAD